jgi:hypothetical protein
MKLIHNIINDLKEGKDIEPQFRKVIGELLHEMMLRDAHSGELYQINMSKEMYMRINTAFYTPEGLFKFKQLKI